MAVLNRKEPLLLLCGDLVLLVFSLWLMLILRYGAFPDQEIFLQHLVPFSLLFIAWIAIFFIAGLYEKHTTFFLRKLPGVLLRAEIANSLIAVLFFYFIPDFGISPKVNLFIYLFISFALILFWRMYSFKLLGATRRENALLIGGGGEVRELLAEVNGNPRYPLKFAGTVDAAQVESPEFPRGLAERVRSEGIGLIAVDLKDEKVAPLLPRLYDLLFSRIRFVDTHKMYEDIFDRIPLSLVQYAWFLENISASNRVTYDALKRFIDIACAIVFGLISLLLYPFIMLLIKADDGGPVFIFQERVGKDDRVFRTVKFRTMRLDDGGNARAQKKNRQTRVGPFLRKARLDELPQFWNVLKGDLSLIGPRPELPSLVKVYEKEVPFYGIRRLIKPGLSGWAQLYHEKHPHHVANVNETRVKLSYDLYYLKNRSLLLDIKIALKTIKTLLSRSGA